MVLNQKRVNSDVRDKFLTTKVVKHQHTLLREAVDAPSLEAFKFSLDAPLSNLTYLKMTLLTAGGWTR